MRKMQPVLSWNMASSFPDCLKRKEEKLPEQNTGHPCSRVMTVFCISTNSVNETTNRTRKRKCSTAQVHRITHSFMNSVTTSMRCWSPKLTAW